MIYSYKPETDIMDQFLDPETDIKHQFLDPENVRKCQFLVKKILDPESDVMDQFLNLWFGGQLGLDFSHSKKWIWTICFKWLALSNSSFFIPLTIDTNTESKFPESISIFYIFISLKISIRIKTMTFVKNKIYL